MARNQFIQGIQSATIQLALMKEQPGSLDEALSFARKQETVELAQKNLLKTKLEVEEGVKDLVAPLQRPLQLTEMARQLQQLTEEVKQLRLYQAPTRKTAPRWSSCNPPPPPCCVLALWKTGSHSTELS